MTAHVTARGIVYHGNAPPDACEEMDEWNARVTLGAELRAAREAIGASLRATARACRRSPGWLCDVETGRRAPSEEALRTLAARLRVSDAATLDRWCALAGIVPAEMVRALLAAPDRWAAVRRVLGRARP